MPLLLALYQKMSLIRERNRLTLDLAGITSKNRRIKNNIEKRTKFYTSIEAQLEKQANMMKNSFSMLLRNQSGLGSNDFGNIWGGNCISGFVMKELANGINTDAPGNLLKGKDVHELITEYNNPAKTNDGKIDFSKTKFGSEEAYKQFSNMISNAQMAQTQLSNNIQMQTQTYENQVSIWVDAQKEEIEAQKEQELDELSYEETMTELDKESKQQRLEEIKGEIQSYESILKEETQNAAPKFGLG